MNSARKKRISRTQKRRKTIKRSRRRKKTPSTRKPNRMNKMNDMQEKRKERERKRKKKLLEAFGESRPWIEGRSGKPVDHPLSSNLDEIYPHFVEWDEYKQGRSMADKAMQTPSLLEQYLDELLCPSSIAYEDLVLLLLKAYAFWDRLESMAFDAASFEEDVDTIPGMKKALKQIHKYIKESAKN